MADQESPVFCNQPRCRMETGRERARPRPLVEAEGPRVEPKMAEDCRMQKNMRFVDDDGERVKRRYRQSERRGIFCVRGRKPGRPGRAPRRANPDCTSIAVRSRRRTSAG